MKNQHFTLLITLLVIGVLMLRCKKDDAAKSGASGIVITTTEADQIKLSTAVSGGYVIVDGGAEISARGVCWSTSPSPTIESGTKTDDGNGTGSYSSELTSLTENTIYYVRAYATNSNGTIYGKEVRFKTAAKVVLKVATAEISDLTGTTAKSGGSVVDGGQEVLARGVCWGIATGPTVALTTKTTDGKGQGTYQSDLTGLTEGVLYYVRAYATTASGTTYGNEISFKPIATTITDVDGNVYHTLKIGSQVWLVENLKTTKYNDGSPITNAADNAAWGALSTGGYSWYANNSALYKEPYGALYNWFAVNSNKLAPTGWHVATDEDWNTLVATVGGNQVAGGKLKAADRWLSPNTGGTNAFGFTAYALGNRYTDGNFVELNKYGFYWTATENSGKNTEAWNRTLVFDGTAIYRDARPKTFGYPVRCVKD